MPRTLANILTEAEHLDRIAQFTGHDGQAAMSRYGADLLGRAIGHEHQADPVDLGGWALLLADIRNAGGLTATGLVMARTAAREVTAL